MMKAIMNMIAFFAGMICAFSPYQEARIRSLLASKHADQFVSVTDSPLQGVAFTDSSGKKIYVDGARFDMAPIAFSNTISHEILHTFGAVHNEDPTTLMGYHVRLDSNGQVLEDDQTLNH